MPIKDLLAARGYREGENVVYLYRAAGRDEALVDRYAKELVDWKADLVISQMTNSDIAMKKATEGTSIPVVFWSTDPIAAGVVKSWAKSGTNFTGFAYEPTWALQQLRVLKLVVPTLTKVGHLYNHTYAPAANVLRDLRAEAKLLGIEILVRETLRAEEFEPAIAGMKADGAGGILVGPHELFNTNGDTLGGLSLKYRLPMVGCCQVSIARGGALASYSPPNGWPAMADRIDLILKGKAKPEDLPILRSFASPLTLNLKTAAALGLTVPESLVQEAQQIIR
jgi:putative ABC transport system substrate-binding protein